MKFSAAVIGASALLACGTANAADLYSNGGYKDGAAAADPWNGFYLGVNAGYGFGDKLNFNNAVTETNKSIVDNLNVGLTPGGFVGGGQVGYNFRPQNGSFVFGVEADIQGSNIDASKLVAGTTSTTSASSTISSTSNVLAGLPAASTSSEVVTLTGTGSYILSGSTAAVSYGTSATSVTTVSLPAGTTLTLQSNSSGSYTTTITAPNANLSGTSKTSIDWFGTVRGRVGFLVGPNTLPYVTGGLAYGGVGNRAITSALDLAADATRTGWTVGAGLEYALSPKWTVKGEYLYVDLNRDALWGIVPTGATLAANKADNAFNVFRLGLNYHISDLRSPLN
jgi:outer membrane immunogenic protein